MMQRILDAQAAINKQLEGHMNSLNIVTENDEYISCQLNETQNKIDSGLFDFANEQLASRVADFHKSIPEYTPTPLISLSSLAAKLRIDELLVKDESQRFY